MRSERSPAVSPQAEARVAEVEDRARIGRRAVVEIARARGEPAQHRTLGLAQIVELAAHEHDATAGLVTVIVSPVAVR